MSVAIFVRFILDYLHLFAFSCKLGIPSTFILMYFYSSPSIIHTSSIDVPVPASF
ncbi:hypothetical protein BDR03DRAFT_939335 [Suillus americanus]|nr:hypothetical protein BDR03DRAFT_939335 [Suillus americanus]